MNVDEQKFTVQDLINAQESGQLLPNPEYQRGAAWTTTQRAAFIDSIFRCYPVPALFLHEKESKGLGSNVSKKWEIVDGQQRLKALAGFVGGKYSLLAVSEDSKLRLPKSIRDVPAPWAGCLFDQLREAEQDMLLKTKITVFMILPDAMPDEVRDLFIRLQSGTALSRQQIRDAWPGNLGPFVERLAGKLDRKPTHRLFSVIDRRGQRSDDEEDQRDVYVTDRQVCAQLLRVFLARELDSNSVPSVSANELDSLYHQQTGFDVKGPTSKRFIDILDRTADVFERIKWRQKKTKFRRIDVTVVMMFLQDVTRNPLYKLTDSVANDLSSRVMEAVHRYGPVGKRTAGSTLHAYYDWWRENVAQGVGIYLDPNRFFDDHQKAQLRERDGGKCGVCGQPVSDAEAEFDHFPIPYRDGGLTSIDNGRIVHRDCHPRGRPVEGS